MTTLENPEESPCFGCGPRHARGLRLSFARDGDAVTCTHVPKEDEVGWPGLFHTGLHFTVLFEASYWAALTLTGRVHVATGEIRFTQERLPRTGAPFAAAARLVGRDPVRTTAVGTLPDGRTSARLDATWRPSSRATVARAGLALPQYLLDEMEP